MSYRQTLRLDSPNAWLCGCLDCATQAREYPGLCKVGEKKQLFHFTVESTGALRPEEIVQRGADVLKRKLNNILTNLVPARQEMDAAMGIGMH